MKKALALLLALMMCIGIFAACGEEKEPVAKDPVDTPADKPTEPTDKPTEPTDKPEDKPEDKPAEPEKLKPGLQADGVTFVGVMDATDDFTLVIEKPGAAGDERIGKKAEAGKVEVAKYNTAGNRRQDTDTYVLDWASLGLEGCSWEYLGSTFILDVSDKNNPKLTNKPVKSGYFFVYEQIKVEEGDKVTVTLPDGSTFVTANVHYGMIRPNHLLNEGGWYIPKWNDLGGGTTNIFTQEKFMKDYYFYTRCELYDQEMALFLPEVPADYTGPKSPRDLGLVPTE